MPVNRRGYVTEPNPLYGEAFMDTTGRYLSPQGRQLEVSPGGPVVPYVPRLPLPPQRPPPRLEPGKAEPFKPYIDEPAPKSPGLPGYDPRGQSEDTHPEFAFGEDMQFGVTVGDHGMVECPNFSQCYWVGNPPPAYWGQTPTHESYASTQAYLGVDYDIAEPFLFVPANERPKTDPTVQTSADYLQVGPAGTPGTKYHEVATWHRQAAPAAGLTVVIPKPFEAPATAPGVKPKAVPQELPAPWPTYKPNENPFPEPFPVPRNMPNVHPAQLSLQAEYPSSGGEPKLTWIAAWPAPPGPGTREVKIRLVASGLPFRITELGDAVDCFFNAMPSDVTSGLRMNAALKNAAESSRAPGEKKAPGRGPSTKVGIPLGKKIDAVYDNWNRLNEVVRRWEDRSYLSGGPGLTSRKGQHTTRMQLAVECLVRNEIQDFAIGQANRQSVARLNAQIGKSSGTGFPRSNLGVGPAL